MHSTRRIRRKPTAPFLLKQAKQFWPDSSFRQALRSEIAQATGEVRPFSKLDQTAQLEVARRMVALSVQRPLVRGVR